MKVLVLILFLALLVNGPPTTLSNAPTVLLVMLALLNPLLPLPLDTNVLSVPTALLVSPSPFPALLVLTV